MSERPQLTTHEGAATFAPRVGRSPAFLTRYSSAIFLLLLIGLEAGVVRFVIRDVRSANNEVQRMYASSVLGLHRIGSLQYDAQETRRSTLYALTTNDSNLQVVYADQSREADARVTAGNRVGASPGPGLEGLSCGPQRGAGIDFGRQHQGGGFVRFGSGRAVIRPN